MEIPALARGSQDHHPDTKHDLTERLLTIEATGCEYADQCAFDFIRYTQSLDGPMRVWKETSAWYSKTRIKVENGFHPGSDPGSEFLHYSIEEAESAAILG